MTGPAMSNTAEETPEEVKARVITGRRGVRSTLSKSSGIQGRHENTSTRKPAESGASSKWQNSSQCKCFQRRQTGALWADTGLGIAMSVWEGRVSSRQVLSRTELWVANRGREKAPDIIGTDNCQCCIYYVLLILKCCIQDRKILKSLTDIQNIV